MKKRKIILTSMALFLITGCGSKSTLYNMQIDVASKKENKQDWDIVGNAPDIQVFIDKHPMPIVEGCKNTYRCKIAFSSVKDKWYIEVYDKDLSSDDLIAKGDCEEGEECDLGLAKVLIEE
jgi:predicted small lipoprotein YifL